MKKVLSDIVLRAHTAIFANKIAELLEALTGKHHALRASSLQRGVYRTCEGVVAYANFSGRVQGNFVIALAQEEIKRLVTPVLVYPTKEADILEAAGEVIQETLNTAAGHTLAETEKLFGSLTLLPPALAIGKLIFPEIASGTVTLTSTVGEVQCTLLLNMAGIRVSEELEALEARLRQTPPTT